MSTPGQMGSGWQFWQPALSAVSSVWLLRQQAPRAGPKVSGTWGPISAVASHLACLCSVVGIAAWCCYGMAASGFSAIAVCVFLGQFAGRAWQVLWHLWLGQDWGCVLFVDQQAILIAQRLARWETKLLEQARVRSCIEISTCLVVVQLTLWCKYHGCSPALAVLLHLLSTLMGSVLHLHCELHYFKAPIGSHVVGHP